MTAILSAFHALLIAFSWVLLAGPMVATSAGASTTPPSFIHYHDADLSFAPPAIAGRSDLPPRVRVVARFDIDRAPLGEKLGHPRSLVASNSPHIDPGDFANRTPQQIDDLANDAGPIPRGPDPQTGRGAYIDPVTGEQKILCHPGACPPHAHVNDPAGNRLDINGNIVSPGSPEAHLPLSTDVSP